MFNLRQAKTDLSNSNSLSIDCIFLSSDFKMKKVILHKGIKEKIIKDITKTFLKKTENATICTYDPIVTIDDQIGNVKLSEIDKLNQIKDKFNDITNIKKIQTFDDIVNSRAYAIILTQSTNSNRYIFFKKMFSTMYLKSKYKLIFKDGNLEEANSDLFSIDGNFDCTMHNEDIIVFSKYYFEILFDFKNEYARKANETLDKIAKLNIINNMNDIIDESDKITIQKKLAKVTQENLNWFKDQVINNSSNIQTIIQRANLDMEFNDGKIIAHDCSELIHLIQDDYLNSHLSGHDFVVDSKKKVTKN